MFCELTLIFPLPSLLSHSFRSELDAEQHHAEVQEAPAQPPPGTPRRPCYKSSRTAGVGRRLPTPSTQHSYASPWQTHVDIPQSTSVPVIARPILGSSERTASWCSPSARETLRSTSSWKCSPRHGAERTRSSRFMLVTHADYSIPAALRSAGPASLLCRGEVAASTCCVALCSVVMSLLLCPRVRSGQHHPDGQHHDHPHAPSLPPRRRQGLANHAAFRVSDGTFLPPATQAVASPPCAALDSLCSPLRTMTPCTPSCSLKGGRSRPRTRRRRSQRSPPPPRPQAGRAGRRTALRRAERRRGLRRTPQGMPRRGSRRHPRRSSRGPRVRSRRAEAGAGGSGRARGRGAQPPGRCACACSPPPTPPHETPTSAHL